MGAFPLETLLEDLRLGPATSPDRSEKRNEDLWINFDWTPKR
jgi:hypothetical protein